MPMRDLAQRFKAFGAQVLEVDGHDVAALSDAIETAKLTKKIPTVILAKTLKGKGVSFMEGQSKWHGSPIGDEEYKIAMKELRGENQCL